MRRQELLFRPIACSNSSPATATAAVKRHIWTSSSIQGWLCSLSFNLDQFEVQEIGVKDLDWPSNCTYELHLCILYGKSFTFLDLLGRPDQGGFESCRIRLQSSSGSQPGSRRRSAKSARTTEVIPPPPPSPPPCQNHQSSLTAIRPTAKPTSTQPT